MEQGPSDDDLIEFTTGKWWTMTSDERRCAIDQLIAQLPEFRAKQALERRRLAWQRLCPPAYRDTSIACLPNVDKFQEVQRWQYGPRGLILIGPPRSGKTRSAWKLLERLHSERRKIVPLTPMDLKLQVARAWQDIETVEDWIDGLRQVEVLFLDDLDTVKFTEAVEETIYDLFEYRPVHRRPVICTLNLTGAELAARMDAKGRGAKIVERMREYCDVINFG